MNCLRRCLAQHHLLCKHGFTAEVVFGVRREGESLHAHAWLTLNGVVINDSAEVIEAYTALRAQDSPLLSGSVPDARRPVQRPAAR